MKKPLEKILVNNALSNSEKYQKRILWETHELGKKMVQNICKKVQNAD